MKKLLLSLAVLALGASVSNAEEMYKLTFGADYNQKGVSAYETTWDVKVGSTVWNVTNFNNNNNAWSFVRCGSKNKETVSTIVNASAWGEKINEIVINAQINPSFKNPTATDKVNAVCVEVLSSIDATDAVASYDITSDFLALTKDAAVDIKVEIAEPMENMFYRVKISNAKYSSNGLIQINSVTYNGVQEGPVLEDPELAFPEAAYSVAFGTAFEAPVATAKSDGAISYSSLDEEIATVDAETGVVTILAIGSTKIVASIEATDTYKAATAEYVLNVTDPNIIFSSPMGEGFTFEQVSGNYMPWSLSDKYGLYGSAYESKNKVINACAAIAASPVIDLTKISEATLDFKNAFNQYKINDELIDVADFNGYAYLMVKEDGASEWTEIENGITAPEKFQWPFYDNETVSLKEYEGKKIQLGFKYVSTEECAGTWEVQAITVKGKTGTGVEGVAVEEAGEAVYYNMQGVRVANPENGLYIVVKGGKSSKVIL